MSCSADSLPAYLPKEGCHLIRGAPLVAPEAEHPHEAAQDRAKHGAYDHGYAHHSMGEGLCPHAMVAGSLNSRLVIYIIVIID